MTTQYPGTRLEDDELDDLYGGERGDEFGARAWQFVNNVVRFLERAHLLHNRSPFNTVALQVLSSALVGDVIVHDLRGNGAALGDYAARRAQAGDDGLEASGELMFVGVCVRGATTGRKAIVAVRGIVPRTVTGLPPQSAGAPLSVDLTSGKLKVADTGEVVLAYADRDGNAHLL